MSLLALFYLSGAFWRRHLRLLLLCYDVSYSIPSLFVPFLNTYKLFNAVEICPVLAFYVIGF